MEVSSAAGIFFCCDDAVGKLCPQTVQSLVDLVGVFNCGFGIDLGLFPQIQALISGQPGTFVRFEKKFEDLAAARQLRLFMVLDGTRRTHFARAAGAQLLGTSIRLG